MSIGLAIALAVITGMVAAFVATIASKRGMYTAQQVEAIKERIRQERTAYYQRVLHELHLNGTLPPNTGLKMPKQTLTLFDPKGEVVADDGKWKRLPQDNEILRAHYSPSKSESV